MKAKFVWKSKWQQVVNKIQAVRSTEEEEQLLAKLSGLNEPTVLDFVNAHSMNLLLESNDFFEAVKRTHILLRDGSGMSMLLGWVGSTAGLNMNGTDFIPKILKRNKSQSVAVWGTEEPYLSTAVKRIQDSFGIAVVSCETGFQDPGFYVGLAKRVKPDIILLGMGMPKQEMVAQLLAKETIGTPLIICGGAIIDFLGGKTRRAPKWMRSTGIEWIYRLLCEPRRLFARYIVGNPKFLWRLVRFSTGDTK